MSAGLTVDELSITCRVGRAGPAQTQRAQYILDRVIAAVNSELPGLVARVLANEPDSDEIVYLPAVHFDATVNAAWPADRIARALLAPLMRGVWQATAGPDALRFRDRAEMLARFMLDLAQGQAFTREWHEEFSGLKLLPASALLRTLVEGEAAQARRALARLQPEQLRRCVALLVGSDARRTLRMVLDDAAPALDFPALVGVLLAQSLYSLDEPQQQLLFAVAVLRDTGQAPDGLGLGLMRAALRVATQLRLDDSSESECRDHLIATTHALLLSQGLGGVLRGAADDALFGSGSAKECLGQLREALGAGERVEASSACAGPWLLLPSILDFLAAHDLGDHLATGALAAVATAAGKDAPKVWRDTELRRALHLDADSIATSLEAAANLPRGVSPRALPLRSWSRPRSRDTLRRDRAHLEQAATQLELPPPLARLARKAAWRALLAYAHRLPGFAESSFAHLWENFLAGPARVRGGERQLEVVLDLPALHVIWKISGADRAAYLLPDGVEVRVRETSR